MFESEIEMEKKQSSFGPLVVILALVGIVVGGVGYFVYQQKRGLPQEDAKAAVLSIVSERGPAKLSFQTGKVSAWGGERVTDPHYRLLEKAGIIKIGKIGASTAVTLTSDGEKLLTSIPEYSKKADKDGSVTHLVPLATRKLVGVDKVSMLTHTTARVDYSWKWEPTPLGNDFDASGKLVKSFSTWDRSVLIDRFGAAFYSADPERVAVVLVKRYDGWKPMR
jgi:hypothetical protein